MTTRQEQIDERLRERRTVALERIADALAGIDGNLATLTNYIDDTGD